MQGYLRMHDGTEHKVGDSWAEIECFRCGICCALYRPRVTQDEIEYIARKLGMTADDFLSMYASVVLEEGVHLLQNSADTCPFLLRDGENAKTTCSIYLFRPKACKDWVPSLSRPECREGLKKLKSGYQLLLPADIYSSIKARKGLSSAVRDSEDV